MGPNFFRKNVKISKKIRSFSENLILFALKVFQIERFWPNSPLKLNKLHYGNCSLKKFCEENFEIHCRKICFLFVILLLLINFFENPYLFLKKELAYLARNLWGFTGRKPLNLSGYPPPKDRSPLKYLGLKRNLNFECQISTQLPQDWNIFQDKLWKYCWLSR